MKAIVVDEPLVNSDFVETPAARHFIEQTQDENESYHITINVWDYEMVPTALLFALRTRRGMEAHAKVFPFVGFEVVASLLRSGHYKSVTIDKSAVRPGINDHKLDSEDGSHRVTPNIGGYSAANPSEAMAG